MKNFIKVLVLIGTIAAIDAYEICASGESGTFHRDYSTCKSYIACSEGKSYPGECPKEFLFNPDKSACDFPHQVKCDLVCPTTGLTAFNLGKSCTKYIQCANGKATYEECKFGTIFDSKTKSCLQREKASCSFGGKCPDPRVDYSWASEEKCAGYFTCKKGKYAANECTNGLHYNAARQRCDLPAHAKCPIVITKEVEFKDVEIVCPKNGSHFYPHVLDCTSYYVCWEGKPSLLTCNAGLKYDFKRKLCDVSTKVKCITDALTEKPISFPLNDSVALAAASQVASANGTGATQPTPADKEKDGKDHNKKPKKSTEAKQ